MGSKKQAIPQRWWNWRTRKKKIWESDQMVRKTKKETNAAKWVKRKSKFHCLTSFSLHMGIWTRTMGKKSITSSPDSRSSPMDCLRTGLIFLNRIHKHPKHRTNRSVLCIKNKKTQTSARNWRGGARNSVRTKTHLEYIESKTPTKPNGDRSRRCNWRRGAAKCHPWK